MPKIISIEEYVQELAQINTLDNIELLFEFYTVYKKLTKTENLQSFDTFANWGKILIQDFNEIDRYLLDTKKVFTYLTDIEVLKRWNLEADQATQMINKSIAFWDKLPLYYQAFSEHLLSKKLGYQGLVYRQAVANLNTYMQQIPDHSVVFAGFNALNQAEEIIFQRMLEAQKAKVFWDIDAIFLNDTHHDAGLFVRRFYNQWEYYKNNPFEWVVNEFSETKNIQIIGTPKSIGQAKIAGKLIENIQKEHQNLNKVALVLGQEALLQPVLKALPSSVDALNITMGYSAQNNPAQLLIHKLFELHLHALNRPNYEFYYKDLRAVAMHPYLESKINGEAIINKINAKNITFVSYPDSAIFGSSDRKDKNRDKLLNLLFQPWNSGVDAVIERLLEIVFAIKEQFDFEDDDKSNALQNEDEITLAFIYSIFQVLLKISTYQKKHHLIDSLDMLFAIYKQTVDMAEVSFEGEPLKGLQIMGVLESRVLDFETVIITSLNEGVFPAGKSTNSFIPNDVKVELGLPTFKEKDAIYTYHFYHLLLRAKNVYLLYNSEPADGIDKGEKSRFITQLVIEKQQNHNLQELNYTPSIPEIPKAEVVVPKSDLLQQRLHHIASGKGFSPSSIGSYLRSPLSFYKQRVLGIRDIDEVEENIAANTLGTVIHNVLENLYKPYINNFLSEAIIDQFLADFKHEVKAQFKDVYGSGDVTSGKNLIAYKVAEKYIYDFLQLEKQEIANGAAVKILSLEDDQEFVLTDPALPYPVKIAGKVDRIEYRDGKYRITDYKSGAVLPSDVKVRDWNDLIVNADKTKAIQLLCYALMTYSKFQDYPIEVGLISFKNIKSGFISFEDTDLKQTEITDEIIEKFKAQLITLLAEILDPNLPFTEERK
ncbi:PD-(D/E)XK nuclease family protein [Flavobacterium agricola]|uniref:PD-(D/E)XK nuclease family protein n=1 Tax=Flavobacterium agricola TaxID=2870839 RepID=UPI0022235875|nr:PD-(D/E)XK nuclease family protein [Flavobacterium agricola]